MQAFISIATSILVGTLSLALAASAYAAPALVPAKSQILVLGNGAEPRELDPTKAVGTSENTILECLFESLTNVDPVTSAPVPGAASSWDISKDGKTYIFHLRPDGRWSDGTPVVASDFVYAWQRLLNPAVGAEYAYLLYLVRNGREYYDGKIKDPKLLGIRAKDRLTLQVELVNPTPYFLSVTALPTLAPLKKELVERYKGGAAWTEVGHMISNGAFKLAEWNLNEHIKVIPNEFYHGRKTVAAQAAYFLPYDNVDTEEKAFMSGEMQMTNEVNNLKVPQYNREHLREASAYHPFKHEPYLGTYFYMLNVNKPGLTDKRVRQALALTIDRKLITERLLGGGQKPALGLVPAGIPGYQPAAALNSSVTPEGIAQAKKLLADAGYPDGKGLPKLELLYNTSENHKKIALAVQQMWKRFLGIDVTLVNEEWKVFQNSQQSQNYQISRYAWIGDFIDPVSFLDLFVTKGGSNMTGFSHAAYDALLLKASSTADAKSRMATLAQAEAILMEELPVIPVYFYSRVRLVSEKMALRLDDGHIIPWRGDLLGRLHLKNLLLVE